MENSETSMRKAIFYNGSAQDTPEESSWTFYLEHFMCKGSENNNFSNGLESPSLVSDASSLVVKKLTDDDPNVNMGLSLHRSCKKLSFKKRKTKGAIVDHDALEDTASSPVNTPKVFHCQKMNQKHKNSSQSFEEPDKTVNQTAKNDLAISGKEDDHTERKRRGLCLVPVSMLPGSLG